MKYRQADGFPTTYSLNDACRITGTTIVSLRNYIARKILRHVGQVPLAGQERRFTIAGLYEIALIASLAEAGYQLEAAAEIVHRGLTRALAKAYVQFQKQYPERTYLGLQHEYPLVEAEPERWLRDEWAHRDMRRPALWIFSAGREILGPEVARGWGQIRKVAGRLTDDPVVGVLNLTGVLSHVDREVGVK